jgi:hypothetical protein
MTSTQYAKKREALQEKLSRMADDLQELIDNLQEYYDDRSDSWQEGEKGMAIYDLISELESQHGDLEAVDLPTWPEA